MTLSDAGICPKVIETAGNYRAVELTKARELTQLDMLNPTIMKYNVEAVCDFHYNDILRAQWTKHFGPLTFVDTFWMENGWADSVEAMRIAEEWKVFMDENEQVAMT
jgi:hypothetical protein